MLGVDRRRPLHDRREQCGVIDALMLERAIR